MFKYYLYKMISLIAGNEWIIKYYRTEGMSIGKNTHIFSKISTSEPYLIKIGDNVTISTNVTILTHDASIGAIGDRNVASDLCGKIIVGDNCFLGSGAIILPGVSIANKVIVAAGSVVTKSIKESGSIVAGNPAKKIGGVNEFKHKYKDNFYSLHGLDYKNRKKIIKNNPEKLLIK